MSSNKKSSKSIHSDLGKFLLEEKVEEFLLGVNQFNQGYYLECHETFEDIWRVQREPERQLTQGIIQFAVGLHHLKNENKTGAAKLFRRALMRLNPFQTKSTGINVKRLCQEINHLLAFIDESAQQTANNLEKLKIELTDGLFQELAQDC
jgi:uncharacterized protein